MAGEDTVLEEAMDNLKEAGQRIRATQSLMRSEGMTDGEGPPRPPYAPFYGARQDRSSIPRGQAPEGALPRWRVGCVDDPNGAARDDLRLAMPGGSRTNPAVECARGYCENTVRLPPDTL
jgi:hypothetical protein